MKTLAACVAAVALGTTLPAAANPAPDFNASPLNYQSTELNYDNSPLNYRNSLLNYDNSPPNPRSANGIYNSDGHRIGFEVQAPSGVANIFDNNGNRIGYQPARRR